MIRNQLLTIDEKKLYTLLMDNVKHKGKQLDAKEWANDFQKSKSSYKFEDFLTFIKPIFEQAGLSMYDVQS